jgi:hypothetical protein
MDMALFRQKRREPAQVIDLREPAPVRLEFGFPTPCPECSSNGYLDSIDVEARVMYQHCPSCWTKWTTTEQELAHTA